MRKPREFQILGENESTAAVADTDIGYKISPVRAGRVHDNDERLVAERRDTADIDPAAFRIRGTTPENSRPIAGGR